MNNPEATRLLLQHKADLSQKVKDLRQEACRLSAIVRTINSTISPEDILEMEQDLKLKEAYSIKNISHIIFDKE